MHPRSKQWHLIDFVITRQSDLKDVTITRSMRGADGGTDHRLVRTKLNLKIRPPIRRCAPPARLNIRALQDEKILSTFQAALENELTIDTNNLHTTADLTRTWDNACSNILTISRRVLGVNKKKNRDWFDDQATDIHKLIAERNKAFAAALDKPSHARRKKLAAIRSKTQNMIRDMKNQWWTKLAQEVQGYADSGNQKEFYNALKTAYGPYKNASHPVRSADGNTAHRENRDPHTLGRILPRSSEPKHAKLTLTCSMNSLIYHSFRSWTLPLPMLKSRNPLIALKTTRQLDLMAYPQKYLSMAVMPS